MTVLFLVALMLVPLYGSSDAQKASDAPLTALNALRLTIAVDEDAQACGVAPEQIESVVRSGLETSKLQLVRGAGSQLIARANSARVSERICAFTFALEVVSFVTIADTGVGIFAPVWSRQAVTCSPAPASPGLIHEIFQQASLELVADWTKANATPSGQATTAPEPYRNTRPMQR